MQSTKMRTRFKKINRHKKLEGFSWKLAFLQGRLKSVETNSAATLIVSSLAEKLALAIFLILPHHRIQPQAFKLPGSSRSNRVQSCHSVNIPSVNLAPFRERRRSGSAAGKR